MKTVKSFSLCALVSIFVTFVISCNKEETYADQKEKETKAIESFLKRDIVITNPDSSIYVYVGKINVISEERFALQGNTTDLDENQYVLIQRSGVYVQIIDKGYGEPLKSGESARVACRFLEYNILADSLQACNWGNTYPTPDFMDVSNSYGSFTATFASDTYWLPLMYRLYDSMSVPSGWLEPLAFVNIDNPTKDNVDIPCAQVRIIVPHGQGHKYASSQVYPCFYVLTYEKV